MLNHQPQAEQIKQTIDRAQSILIVSHQSPDGDTLGVGNAWIEYLLSRGKRVRAFCLDPLPEYLQFLPNNHHYTTDQEVFKQQFDILLVVDAGSLQYAGIVDLIPLLPSNIQIINIDHHQTNPLFGHQNLVITSASSTCEVVARLFRHWHVPMTKRLAHCLLTGILTDTGALRNPATGHLTLETAAHLTAAGADMNQILSYTFENKPLAQLQLWGLALSRLKKIKKYNLAVTYITHEDLISLNLTTEAMEGLANYLSILQEARTILVLKTDEDLIRGSFRTAFETPDVSKVAQALGGGGHKKAAAFRLPGKLIIDGDRWTVV
jgi:phosphoesterase RecJ-like protein